MRQPEYELRLLGPPILLHQGQTVHLSYQKAAAILAYVAAEGHSVTRERLRTLLWEESDEHRASANLRHALHELRSSAPGLLSTEGDRVGLEPGTVQLDLTVLQEAKDEAGLETAYKLRRGPFCEGLSTKDSAAFEEWLTLQRSRWDALYLTAVMALSDQYSRSGDADAAMEAAREALSTDPLHEPAHAQLIRLYLARGETAAAHRQLQECQRLMESELGVPLSAETVALLNTRKDDPNPPDLLPETPVTIDQMLDTFRRSQQMTTDDKQRMDAELEDLRTLERGRALPNVLRERVVGAMPTAVAQHFKNRTRELEQLHQVLAQANTRLVVVCGRGGLGKTALVTHFLRAFLAREEASEEPDVASSVVYLTFRHSEFCSLSKLVDLICRTLDVSAANDLRSFWARAESLPERLEFLFHRILGAHRTLIVLDNLEIILDDENQLRQDVHELRAFIESCVEWDHGVRILATSRRSLLLSPDLEGRAFDRYIEVPLDSGLPESEAIDLLLELDADGSLGIRNDDPELLRRVVRACHGIPRTLETLAGTLRQRRTLTLASLVADEEAFQRLTENPARELYEALSSESRLVCQALAVFDRPVPAAAVRFLLPALPVEALLDALVLNYAVGFDGGRFFLHRLMQQYCYRQVPAKTQGAYAKRSLHRRAAEFFAELRKPKAEWKSIDDVDSPLQEFQQRVWAGDYDLAGQVVNELDGDYLSLWGYPTMIIDMRKQLAGRLREVELASQNWGRLGVALRDTGDVEKSLPYLEQALELARQQDDAPGIGLWLSNLGLAQGRLGHWNRAVEYASSALDIARRHASRSLEASALGLLGHAYRHLGRLTDALEVYQQATAISQELGDRRREGIWWNVVALARLGLGQAEAAREACQTAWRLAQEVGHRPGEGAACSTRGKIENWQGRFEQALAPLQEALDIASETNLVVGMCDCLETMGYAYHHLGDLARAADLYQQTQELDAPIVSYMAIMRQGLLSLEQGDAAGAQARLSEGIKVCEALILDTPEAFRRVYALALGLLANREEGRAVSTYTRAMKVSAEPGIVHEALQHLQLLERAGVSTAAARQVLEGRTRRSRKRA